MPHDEITLENMQAYMKARQEKLEAEVAEILAQNSWEDTPTTTVIHGKNYWGTCYRHACYLAKYIYSLPNNPNFTTEYPEKMAEVEEHWQQWDFLNHESGLMGVLFKQKNYDPKSEKALCPPMLVFRGTGMEDFRGLGAFVRFTPDWKGMFWKNFRFPWVGESGVYVGGWGREDFTKAGYDEHLLYEEESVITNALLAKPFGWEMNINVNIKLELYIYTKDGYGDWSNNFTQGMGKGSEQYKRAIQFGRDIVSEKVKRAADKRLMVTGHSLGGGLAAATCCVLNAEYDNVTFDSIIFNAAGVHRNTIARNLKPDISVDGAMSRNPCIDICVQDEILTTLGAYHKKLPILGSIFTYVARHIGQHGLPNPLDIAQLFDIPGYSPGTSAQQAKHAQDFENLPNHIKPILESDADKAAMEMKQAIDHLKEYGNELEFSKNMQDLGNRGMRNRQLASMIDEGQYGDAVQKIDEILEAEAPREDAPYEAALKHTRSVLAAEISPIALPPKGVALRRLFPIEQQNATAMPRPDGFPLITALDSSFYDSCFDQALKISQSALWRGRAE